MLRFVQVFSYQTISQPSITRHTASADFAEVPLKDRQMSVKNGPVLEPPVWPRDEPAVITIHTAH